MRERSACGVLAGKLEGNKPLGRARRRWDYQQIVLAGAW
jgi:hypothetical protein